MARQGMTQATATIAGILLFSTMSSGMSSASAAEPDAFDKIDMALEIGSQCKAFRGFEAQYLRTAWQEAWNGSAAKAAAERAEADARKASPDPAKADAASVAARAVHAAANRERALALGCQGGASLIRDARVEALRRIGGLMTLAGGQRAIPTPPMGMRPLSAEERDLLNLFVSDSRTLFGAQMAQFEQLALAEANARLARANEMTTTEIGAEIAAASIEYDQSLAFAAIRLEAAAAGAGYTVRGVSIADGSPFGFRTTLVGKDQGGPVVLVDQPRPVRFKLRDGNDAHAYVVMAVRPDKSLLIGLFGEGIEAHRASLSVAVETSPMSKLVGRPLTADCPFETCFTVPAADVTARLDHKGVRLFRVIASTMASPTSEQEDANVMRIRADDVRSARAFAP